VGLSFVRFKYLEVGQIGDSMEWKNGNISISAGSNPVALLWASVAVALFVVLMVRKSGPVAEGVPTSKRRILAFLIDFWFSLLVTSSIGALIPLMLEAGRTGHFVWHFQRNYATPTDPLAALGALLFMALITLYFVFPLIRGRQTVGYFILRLKLTPPFGTEGRFTLRTALIRTYYAFIGGISIFRNWDRDVEGRTWYDRESNSTVVFVSD
jgi:RDD family